MMSIPEVGKSAGNVLIDALSAFELDASDNDAVMMLALQRLGEVGAVTSTDDDETGDVTVEVGELVWPALYLMNWLANALAQERGESDISAIVGEMRDYLEE